MHPDGEIDGYRSQVLTGIVRAGGVGIQKGVTVGSGHKREKGTGETEVETMKILFLVFAPVLWCLILTTLFVVYLIPSGLRK